MCGHCTHRIVDTLVSRIHKQRRFHAERLGVPVDPFYDKVGVQSGAVHPASGGLDGWTAVSPRSILIRRAQAAVAQAVPEVVHIMSAARAAHSVVVVVLSSFEVPEEGIKPAEGERKGGEAGERGGGGGERE
jgi:hypothetical protein